MEETAQVQQPAVGVLEREHELEDFRIEVIPDNGELIDHPIIGFK